MDIKTRNVLDLPEDKQLEIANRHGQSLADWRAGVVERDKRAAAFSARLDANEGVLPEGWTQEGEDQLQARVDSGNPTKV